MAGRSPDYNVGIFNKETEFKGRIGAAWKDEKTGRISIVLDPMVMIHATSKDWYITLFPVTEGRDAVHNQSDDEIPF